MEPDKATKIEDRRAEYTALRAEVLQADNICLLMMGYLVTAVGFLYSESLEWLVSFLSLISLCYFTEKRFNIRKIASFIVSEVCKDDSGFGWEKYVQKLREQGTIRPFVILRPYNAEVITCSVIALSPAVRGELINLAQFSPSAVFWFVFALLTLTLSVVNFIKYNCA
ncbi:hypothetical protein IQ232_01245 [Microcystis aeruginosa LEGE 11464]|jgi:hypothetical protein|uniref:hypothetical protein n=1 Tax=Microcystis aeruginosa TaxID=1126 RepID=UPI001880DB25|nr:hypothetical protein [Microcystis aeruginosa]MBE9088450.1 hypothetical protein [Microcystis aeruginosa LEGE 11464]MCZ8128542.1 hypothetical protein [Microcystis sp. LE19-114.1B]